MISDRGIRVKTFTKQFAVLWLVLAALASGASQAGETAQNPPPPQPASGETVKVAWDRVGSPINPFG